jgi:hypothetical protein
MDLLFCRVDRKATLKMETEFRKWYQGSVDGKVDASERKLDALDLFVQADAALVKPYHFVFALDDSGSMSGQPWIDLERAYHQFLDRRRSDQGGSRDLVSIVLHHSTTMLALDRASIISPQARVPLCPRWGGNSFYVALQGVREQLNKVGPEYTPMMIFMSDGGDCRDGNPNAPEPMMRQIYEVSSM